MRPPMSSLSLPEDYLAPLLALQARSIPVTVEAINSSFTSCNSHLDALDPDKRASLQPALFKLHNSTLSQYRQASLSAVAAAKVSWSNAVAEGRVTADTAVERFAEEVGGWGGPEDLPEGEVVKAEIKKAIRFIRGKRRIATQQPSHDMVEDHCTSAPRNRDRPLPIPSDDEEEEEPVRSGEEQKTREAYSPLEVYTYKTFLTSLSHPSLRLASLVVRRRRRNPSRRRLRRSLGRRRRRRNPPRSRRT